MKTRGFGESKTGIVRALNEDSVLFDDGLNLYIVADGVGGLTQGDRASSLAVEVCARELSSLSSGEVRVAPEDQLATWLRDSVLAACRAVHEEAVAGNWVRGEGKSKGRMATTLTVLWLVGPRAVLCHVGDSRAYHWHDGGLSQITADHTIAEELARAGVIEKSEVGSHPYRSVLSRTVGSKDKVEPDTLVFDYEPGDRFLLCTDGLSRYVPEGDWLGDILANNEPQLAIDRLIRHALESGGADNVTALVVVTEAPDRKPSSARARTSVWERVRRALEMKKEAP